jgi:1-deoxy-D-xylulose-5-phosphate reductoisomerase
MSRRRADDADDRRGLTILGSTGSVGCSTVDLVERSLGAFRVEALTGHRNATLLADQARRLGARIAVVGDPAAYDELRAGLSGTGIEAAAGADALIAAAERPAEVVIAGIVGSAGLAPTLAAVRRGAIIGLANKECLVSAGSFMVTQVETCGARIVPVDSEHSAIFQVFDFDNAECVEKIILTASGGPFRTLDRRAMALMTPSQAVAHPNWDMGAKISVDSATMMNKGLELIEAFHLFPISADQIDIVVHPQSVVHSLVAYCDGSVLAQMGTPDMRTPIAYALAWPRRMPAPVERLRLVDVGTLTFEAPDPTRFPALRVARSALAAGGSAPTVMNAANEVAVQHFLAGEIGFLDIIAIVEDTLGRLSGHPLTSLDDVLAVDQEARDVATVLAAQWATPAVSAG